MVKLIFFINLIILTNFNLFGQNYQINTSFFVYNKEVLNVEYYLIENDTAYQIQLLNNKIIIPDTLKKSNYIDLLIIYKKHIFNVPKFNYKEAYYLNFYFDNSLFHNKVNKQFGGYCKFKFLFVKRYLIDDGLGFVTIVKENKKKYIFKK